MTVNEQYKKERKRIQSFISKAEKKGYKFDYELPPSVSKLDKVTKKMVNELKKITPKKLRKTGYYGGELTQGVFISAEEGFKLERSESARKGNQTRKENQKKKEQQNISMFHVVDEIVSRLEVLPDIVWFGFVKPFDLRSRKQMLISLLYDRLDIASENGTLKQFYKYIDDNKEQITGEIDIIKYNESNEEAVTGAVNRLAKLFKGGSLTLQEAKDLEELNSYYENWEYEN